MSASAENVAPGSLRELLRLAIPLIVSSGSLSVMHVIDRIFLAWYSTDALAAAMPAGLMYWSLISLAVGLVSYVNTFIAQYEGAKRPRRVAAALWQAIGLSVIAGLAVILLIPLTSRLLLFGGHSPSVQELEIGCFQMLCFGGVPHLAGIALSCFFSGRGETKYVLWANLLSVATNALFDALLIFGLLGMPRWGIVGASLATNFGHLAAVAFYLAVLARPAVRRQYPFRETFGIDRELMFRMLRFGLPNGFLIFVDVAGFTLFIFLIGRFGTDALAATSLAFNLNSLAFVPMIGLGLSVSTLVGKRIGERRPDIAAKTVWNAFRLGGGFALAAAMLYVTVPTVIMTPFSAFSDADEFQHLQGTAVVLLRFVAVYSFFDAMAIIFSSAIRGAGDTRFAMVFTILCVWGALVGPCFAVWYVFGPNLYLCWAVCSAYIITLGLGFLWRFLGGQWRSMTVVEDEPDEDDPPITSPSLRIPTDPDHTALHEAASNIEQVS